MSKKNTNKSKISLDHIETNTDDVFALIGAEIAAEESISDSNDSDEASSPRPQQPTARSKSRSTSPPEKPRSKKPTKLATNNHNDTLPDLTDGELTQEQLQWFFSESPKDNGTLQIRLSKETKDALFYVANGGGVAGSQLADNIIKWWIRTYMKPIRKFIKHDPLNSL